MFSDFIINFALFTAILFFLSRLFPQQEISRTRLSLKSQLAMGVIMGLFGMVLMLFSIHASPTTILDYRQLAVVTASLLGGVYSSLLAAVLIGLFRVIYFGGFNPSSVVAMLNIIFLALVSSYMVKRIFHYWLRWAVLIALMASISIISLYGVLGTESLDVLPNFIAVLILGSVFVAYLMQYLLKANALQQRLKENEERYRKLNSLKEAVFESATEVSIIVTDPEGQITLFNKGAEKMLGYTEREMIGKQSPVIIHLETELARRGQELSSQLNKDIQGFQVFTESPRNGQPEEREWTYVKKDGSTLIVNLYVTALRHEGELMGYVGIATNITEQKLAEQQLKQINRTLQQLSSLDGLTEIPNRRSFDERLAGEWEAAEKNQSIVSLIMFDIDFFKAYNDTYGHLGGDECLKQVARTAAGVLDRKDDFISRYGGEEFGVIVPGASLAEAAQLAEAIRNNIQGMGIVHQGSKVSEVVTISVGVAAKVPQASETYLDLIAEADAALYQSKQNGRNRVTRFEQAWTEVKGSI